jgi:hypothetical protein
VTLKPGVWVDPAQMLQKVKDAGFKAVPEDVRLTVTGKVEKRGDGLVIVLDQMKSPVELMVVAAKDNPDTAAHLNRHVNETVELEGLWGPAPPGQSGAGSLAATAIYGAEDKKPSSDKK